MLELHIPSESLPKIFGQRLRQARKFLQVKALSAADDLGFQVEDLYLIEDGRFEGSIPFSKVHKAARYYGVSMDWLMGISEYESPMETEYIGNLLDAMVRQRVDGIARIMRAETEVRRLQELLPILESEIEGLTTTFQRFIDLNPSFRDDMRCGAAVVSRLNKVSSKTRTIMRNLGVLGRKILTPVPVISAC